MKQYDYLEPKLLKPMVPWRRGLTESSQMLARKTKGQDLGQIPATSTKKILSNNWKISAGPTAKDIVINCGRRKNVTLNLY